MIKQVLWVGLGGGIGSMARYLCQRWFSERFMHHFPWGTFAVNITGCLLIGLLWGVQFRSFDSNINWKLFLMAGVCGGFTTFSAFTLESIGLIREQRMGLFFAYVAGSLLLGLVATFVGMKITH